MQNGNDAGKIDGVRKNLCEECFTGKHKCFVCKEYTKEVTKCSEKKCGKFYHLKCIQDQNYPHKILNEEQNKFKCPLHICLTCYNEHLEDCVVRTVKKKLLNCIKCPTSYHHLDSCIAAGSIVVDPDHLICPEHDDDVQNENPRKKKKHAKKHVKKHVNVSWCFSCNFGGDLICCERCPTSKHLNCIIEDEGKAPDNEGYFCPDCRGRKQFHYNDIIWVKLGPFRWWPAQIKHPTNVPDNILNRNHSDADFPVYFFGSKDYYWVNRSRSFLYMEGDDQKKISTSGKGLDKTFKLAMIEVVEAFKELQEQKNSILQSKTVNPAPYFHLKVNKPFGKCQQAFVDMDKSNKQICECTEKDPCSSDQECLNRLLMYECDGAICKNQDKCKNQRFKKREYAKTEKFKTQAGWGLRCLEDIKKGQFVIEYVGELIDEEECNKRLKEMASRNDRNFYFLTIDKETIIDAGPKGNLARFMNHSCNPNCETQKWVVNNQVRVGLFAKCDIPCGTELTFNYNLECRGDEKTKCLCNSKNCSGFIGVRPNKIVQEKQKETKKRKLKPAFASIHEDECFRCGEVGKLIMCDKRDCPKSYHLECLNLDKIPHGKWTCPLHHCDVCGKKAIKFCNHCPTSFCVEHQNDEMKTLPNGELICNDHSTAYLNQVKRIASKPPTDNVSTTPKIKIIRSSAKKENQSSTSKLKTPSSSASKSNAKTSNLDQNTGHSIKKPRRFDQEREEFEEMKKKEEERKRLLIESREKRMKKRLSLHENQISTPTTLDKKEEPRTKRKESISNKQETSIIGDEKMEIDVNLNDLNSKSNDEPQKNVDLDVDLDVNFNSNSSDSHNLKTSITNDKINLTNQTKTNEDRDMNDQTKERMIEEEENKLKDNSNSNGQSSGSSPIEKSISQKENNFVLEIEQIQTVGKILSDEILFNDDSNESYLSLQTNSQTNTINGNSSQPVSNGNLQNGKLKLDQSQINGTSKNNENKNHNLKLTTASSTNLINELNNESTS